MVNFNIGWLPIIVLFAGVIMNLIIDILQREDARNYVATSTTLFLGLTIGTVLLVKDSVHSDYFMYGEFFTFFSLIGLFASFIVVFVAWKDMSLELDTGVFFSLLLIGNMGGIVIGAAKHMVALYIGYELVSLPSYAMAAFKKRDKRAAEAALKFFLLGALSSAILVYGLTMYYGATGTFSMGASALPGAEGLKFAAIILIISGSGFKIGLVPFHWWIGDVYSGSPSSVVVWLAAASKKMAFAFVIQLFFVGMVQWRESWGIIFTILAIISILLGNIAAVIQKDVMRILAYSTIAQAGYIMIGFASFAAATDNGQYQAAMVGIGIQIIAHVLMKGVAITATFVIIDNYGGSSIEYFRGLFYKNKLVAYSMAIALFSLMGIPPLLGAFGKWFLFLAAVDTKIGGLAIIGLIGSAISIYYYMKILNIMTQKPTDSTNIKVTTPVQVILVLLTVMTMLLPIVIDRIIIVINAITAEIMPPL